MKKLVVLILGFCLLSGFAYGMYDEGTEPSERDSQYARDKEDPEDVTLPEMQTEMPEAMQDISEEQEGDPQEEYVEDNVGEDEREALNLD